MKIFSLVISFICIFVTSSLFAQQGESIKKNKSPYPTQLTSPIDDMFIINKITLVSSEDNVKAIYSKPAFEFLANKIKYDPFWSYAEPLSESKIQEKLEKIKNSSQQKNKIAEYKFDLFENNSELTSQILNENQVDAFYALRILKGPSGVTVQLDLYSKDRGLLLLHEEATDKNIFEVDKVNELVNQLYQQSKQKMPFSGFITSRSGNHVTLNVGARRGIKNKQTLPVVQILKVNRHPKMNFMISVEKEIIGRVVITNVQEESSYGEIVLEIEPGVIKVGSKLLSLNPTEYDLQNKNDVSNILPREKNPTEWLPEKTPQFGKAVLLAGISSYNGTTVLSTNEQISSTQHFAPSFLAGAELWLTPDYYANVELKQDSFSTKNHLSGSSPSDLNYTIRTTDINFGYRYHIDGLFWGPNLYASLGYMTRNLSVTDTTPTAFTSYNYHGLDLTAGGYFPVTTDNDVAFGAQVKLMLNDAMSESPVSSGGASPKYTQFDILGYYQYTTNINLKGMISIANMQTSFNQTGDKSPLSRSLDEKTTSYMFGIEYLF